jgi:hypothetical protein
MTRGLTATDSAGRSGRAEEGDETIDAFDLDTLRRELLGGLAIIDKLDFNNLRWPHVTVATLRKGA